eukprot:gene6441-7172_t
MKKYLANIGYSNIAKANIKEMSTRCKSFQQTVLSASATSEVNVKVRAHSGATSADISDHIKPLIRRKPDCVTIHCGTNDITSKEEMDTIKNLKPIIPESERQTNVGLSSETIRIDRVGTKKEVTNLNKCIQTLAEGNAYAKAATIENAFNGFRCTGIVPFNKDIDI